MKPTDHVRQYHKESYVQQLLAALGGCLPARGLPLQVSNGKIRWTPRMLVIRATLMSWASGMAAHIAAMVPGRRWSR